MSAGFQPRVPPPPNRLKLGLIGDPVAHSLSPAFQQPALDLFGVPATYELWPTPAADLPARVASLRAPATLGANVTVPHKLAVMDLLDDVSSLARRAGAVNTVIARDGLLHGDNTDVHGFAASLTEVLPEARSASALVLGAGGAARAVVLALESLGVTTIALANRDPARARRLVEDLAPSPVRLVRHERASLGDELRQTTVLVNATAAGWHPGETPLPLELLSDLTADALVVDLTYRDTDLLHAAQARSLPTLDGLPMLVHQGARAFELWTGQRAPYDHMLDAARSARSG